MANIRDKVAAAIEERNLLTGVQTIETPGCTLNDLRVLVQETQSRVLDTCFASKNQLSMSASGEFFLHIARIKTSVLHGISIYKAAPHWEQCMLHGLGMLFVGASDPSCYVFPLVPHATSFDLPEEKTYIQDEAILYWESLVDAAEDKGEPVGNRVRGTPNVSKYINDIITLVSDRLAKASAPLPPEFTAGLSSHPLRGGSAAYANTSPQLAIQWISIRGAWLLDSLTKAFAYVGTTTQKDQSVGKILAGYKYPHLPCITPSVATLKKLLPVLEYAQLLTLRGQHFKNVSGFTDTSLNVDAGVLDAVLAPLLIHIEDVAAAVGREQEATGFTSHYQYSFHEALDATDAALGSRLSLETCVDWRSQLRAAWETENHAQLGERCRGGYTGVLAAAVTQMLASMATMQRTLHKLVAMQEEKPRSSAQTPACTCSAAAPEPSPRNDVRIEAYSLAGCLYNWYSLELWHTATQKKQHFIRADLKAFITIMMTSGGRDVDGPAAPLERDGVAYRLWNQAPWTLAEDLDSQTNTVLGNVDGKGRCNTAGSLRTRWRRLRLDHRPAYDALCSAFITREANGGTVDRCTPDNH